MNSFYTIGTDTELFARNRNGEMIALCGKIGGNKIEPLQIKALPKGFCIQEDNVAVEFNIPPCDSESTFSNYIQTMLDYIGNLLDTKGLEYTKISATSFSKGELSHPNALVFGCEPDYSAWTRSENPKPQCNDETFRTAGGHVHVGTNANMINAVQMMDLYLGVPSVLLDTTQGAVERRKLYGKAGAMRPKPYGFEYRVLSNFWVFENKLRKWVFNNTNRAISLSNTDISEEASLTESIVSCINNSDKEAAKKLIIKYKVPMPA